MPDKATTLNTLDEEYRNLHQAFAGLDEEQLSRIWFGDWSVKDIIAHVAGWEREMTAALQRMARGERPTPEGVDYSDSDAWNAKFASLAHTLGAPTLIAGWEQTHAAYAGAARALPDDRFGETDGKPKTANRLLETSGFGHYREHAAQIRAWRQREGL
jgi:hypothetical protein